MEEDHQAGEAECVEERPLQPVWRPVIVITLGHRGTVFVKLQIYFSLVITEPVSEPSNVSPATAGPPESSAAARSGQCRPGLVSPLVSPSFPNPPLSLWSSIRFNEDFDDDC